jgi:hypothetical protein
MASVHRLPPGCIGTLCLLVQAACAQAAEPAMPAGEPMLALRLAGPGLRVHPAAGPGAWTPDTRLGPLSAADTTRSLAVSGRLGRRSRTLWQASWRGSDSGGDNGNVTTASLLARHRNLAARLTYRHGEARDLHAIVEWSTARPTPTVLPNAIFRSAVGLDQRLAGGTWLEWRIGQRMIPARDRTETAFAIGLRITP